MTTEIPLHEALGRLHDAQRQHDQAATQLRQHIEQPPRADPTEWAAAKRDLEAQLAFQEDVLDAARQQHQRAQDQYLAQEQQRLLADERAAYAAWEAHHASYGERIATLEKQLEALRAEQEAQAAPLFQAVRDLRNELFNRGVNPEQFCKSEQEKNLVYLHNRPLGRFT
jgi:chromosome segregation ATPase